MTNSSDVKWEQVALGDACEIVNGGTPKTKVGEYWGGPHAWVTPAEMGRLDSPFVRTTKRTLSDKGLKKSSASLLPEYSVILSSRAPIGHLVINETPMATNQGCRGLVPHEKLHYKFLYYFLLSNVRLLNDLGTGATFKELSATKLKIVLMPIPSIAEQKRIVAILDEAFAAIATATANTKKNIANAKELFDSELNSVFQHPQPAENSVSDVTAEWRETTLGETCEILDRRRKPITKRNRISGPYPYYGATGIVDYVEGYLFDEPLVLVGEDGAKWDAGENSAFAVNGRCWVNNHAHVLRPNRSVLLDNWLIYYLNQSDLTPFITGLTVPKLNQAKLCEIAIPLPPLFEQKRIATFLDKLSAEKQTLVETYKTKIHSLAELKQSLLHQAFTGELTAATKAAKSPTPAER